MPFTANNPFRTSAPRTPKKKRSNQPGKRRAEWADLDNLEYQIEETPAQTWTPPAPWTSEDYNFLIYAILELIERQREALNIYTPLPKADEFHRCFYHEIALSGSNRAGKTTAASAEVGMAALGVHYVENKYPTTGVQIACIGDNGRHLSLMYEYLFEKPPFNVFQHPLTYQWHVVIEDDPEHQKFKHLWGPGLPIIPRRMVLQEVWELKGEKIPSMVTLTNGTEIRFYSGMAKTVPKGRKFHLVWMDEEIDNPGRWIDEMRARIIDYDGRIFWSATPQRATQEFFDIEMRAEDPDAHLLPFNERAGFFVMESMDNKFLAKAGNIAFMNKLKADDEQLRTRFFGKTSRGYLSAYPEYGEHNLIGVNTEKFNLWWEDTRYIIIDPGVDVAAVLFVCCPAQAREGQLAKMSEEEQWYRNRLDCIVVYDELYIRQANPDLVAMSIQQKLNEYPTSWIQDFTIDEKGGKSMIWRGIPANSTCEAEYWKALQKHNLIARENHGWMYGSHDKEYGVRRTQSLLVPDFDHLPRLFIHRRCKKLMWEFKHWQKKRNKDGEFIGYQDKNNHLLDCVRYATTRPSLVWVPPPDQLSQAGLSKRDFDKIMKDIRTGAIFFKK